MKKIILLSAVSVFSLMATNVMAQAATTQEVTGTGNVSAVIVQKIGIEETQKMHFGAFDGTTGGTAKLSTAGKVEGLTNITTTGATPQAGLFSITGTDGTHFKVSVAQSFLKRTDGSETMDIKNFTFDYNGAGPDFVLATGTPLKVGADLIVGSKQTPGTYEGNYTITVSY